MPAPAMIHAFIDCSVAQLGQRTIYIQPGIALKIAVYMFLQSMETTIGPAESNGSMMR